MLVCHMVCIVNNVIEKHVLYLREGGYVLKRFLCGHDQFPDVQADSCGGS